MKQFLIFLSFVASVGFVLVSYQNCSQNSSSDLGSSIGTKSVAGCNMSSFSSNQELKNTFTVGEIANFIIASDPSGLSVQYVLQSDDGSVTQNSSAITPYFFQQTNSDLGNFTLTMTASNNGKSVCTQSLSYSVEPPGTTTCQLSATSGTSFLTGQAVPFKITSSPGGLAAFITGGAANRTSVPTVTAFSQSYATAGTYPVYAEVKDLNGVYIRCTPSVSLTIAANPNPSPTPVPTPGVSPTPTPTAPPKVPQGSISIAPQYQANSTSSTLSWTFSNTPYVQVWAQQLNLTTLVPTGAYVFVKCGTLASDSILLDWSDVTGTRYEFYLYSATSCTQYTQSQLPTLTPLSQYLGGWRGQGPGGNR